MVGKLQRNEESLSEEETQQEPVKDGFELFATWKREEDLRRILSPKSDFFFV